MSAETLRRAAAQIRNDRGGVVSRHTQDGRRWLPVADWLDDLANRIVLSRSLRHDAEEAHATAVARTYLGED